jgi:hypothetical protein
MEYITVSKPCTGTVYSIVTCWGAKARNEPHLLYKTKADLRNVHLSHLHFISKAGRTDSPNGHLFVTKQHAL